MDGRGMVVAAMLAACIAAIAASLAACRTALRHDVAAPQPDERLSAIEIAILRGRPARHCTDCLAADLGRSGGRDFQAHAQGELAWRRRRLRRAGLLRTRLDGFEIACGVYAPPASAGLLAAWIAAMMPDYGLVCGLAETICAAAAMAVAVAGPPLRTTSAGRILADSYARHPWNPDDPREAPIALAASTETTRRMRRIVEALKAGSAAFRASLSMRRGPA